MNTQPQLHVTAAETKLRNSIGGLALERGWEHTVDFLTRMARNHLNRHGEVEWHPHSGEQERRVCQAWEVLADTKGRDYARDAIPSAVSYEMDYLHSLDGAPASKTSKRVAENLAKAINAPRYDVSESPMLKRKDAESEFHGERELPALFIGR